MRDATDWNDDEADWKDDETGEADWESYSRASIQAGEILPIPGKRKRSRSRKTKLSPEEFQARIEAANAEAETHQAESPFRPVATRVYAGQLVTQDEIRGTLAVLRYYRRFLASEYRECKCPEPRGWPPEIMTKEKVRRRVGYLINMSINRKAGIPDDWGKLRDGETPPKLPRKMTREYQIALFRDCHRVRDRVNRRIVVHEFETKEIRARYAHLLSDHDEY